MSDENPEVQVMFVKIGEDGKVERTHHFEPFDPLHPLPAMVEGVEERPAVRHVTYDDPPGIGLTSDEYRAMLATTVEQTGNLEMFVQTVSRILITDNIRAHGVHPQDAVPAVMEFAMKVYAEFSGAV